ncbi:hypothetical protein BKA62DRAFT_749383 [Auriculariales sp. MPI-PUGE-AT-0066]|nr:hypothetical protein BKA62DRAFT_749383 [Auriculariales sp. MPI-PUGE-AT-0066]
MDVVPGDQYRYALANFRIAHEKVESQRQALEQQEQQVALLRQRIALLEGSDDPRSALAAGNSSSVDDFTIRNAASGLDRLINRYAADLVRAPPVHLSQLRSVTLGDLNASPDHASGGSLPMITQNLLRHAMAESLSEGVLNCFLVTNSAEANVQLSRLHEHLFARDPVVASVWRRQTFSACIDNWQAIVDAAHAFGRMLHASRVTGIGSGSAGDAFYRAFVPEVGASMMPQEVELTKRCTRSERGETDRVGATLFPGLVKVTKAPDGAVMQTVVRRAQCICECALAWTSTGNTQTPISPSMSMRSGFSA